jgi:ATP-dependent helicase/nuclease subunit B
VFLDVTKASAAILPRIVAIGDVDEDEIAFAQAATGALAGRRSICRRRSAGSSGAAAGAARAQWAASIRPSKKDEAPLVASNPASALALADDLARLMDDMTTRGVPWDRLDELVPEALDRYWQLTLEFLKIAREDLAEHPRRAWGHRAGRQRDALIKAEAARLAHHTDGPVIAAGSTGSMPATAELIATIAQLPHGAVVLPASIPISTRNRGI